MSAMNERHLPPAKAIGKEAEHKLSRKERRAQERKKANSAGAKFRRELNEAFHEGKFGEGGGILAMINERKVPVTSPEALEALRREHEAGNL